MEEPGERCFLQFSCVNAGLQVFLEDILLYTDFPQQENRVDVFLQNADFAGINYNGLCIPLPLDCAGKTLRIVTYGPSLNGLRVPVFPSQASRFSDAVVQTTGVVWCMTAVTVRLMLALSLLLVLVLGAQAGQPLWKLLPLSGYSGKCFGAECRQWSAELGLPDPHGLSVHLLGSRTSGQKTLGLGCHSPAAYSAYCLAEFCGGAASHRKSR